MTPLFEVIRDSSTYGITRIASVALGLVAIPLFAHILSPDMLGRYSIALLTVTISSQVVNEWSRSSILRFDAKFRKTNQYDAHLSNLFLTPMLIGLIIGLTGLLIGYSSELFEGFRAYVWVCAVVFSISIIDSLLITLLRVRQQAKKFSIILLIKRFVALATGVGLVVLLDVGGEGLIYGMLISLAIAIPLAIRWTSITKSISISYLSKTKLKRYLLYGLPLTLFTLSAFLLRYTDRYMISYFKNMDQVGLYSFASLLPQRTIETLIGIVSLGAFPVIVKEWERAGSKSSTGITSSLARYHMLLTVPIVSIMLLFPRELISLAGTPQYEVAYTAVPLLAMGSYFTSIAWFSSIAFRLSTKTGLLLAITLASLVVNFTLNLFAIPTWGFRGAAFATMTTSILYFATVFSVSRKWLPWRIRGKSITRILIAAVVSGGFSFAVKMIIGAGGSVGIVGLVLLFIAAYGTMLQLLGELNLRKLVSLSLAYLGRKQGLSSDD